MRGEQPRDLHGSPLRILAVGNRYPPHHTGGYELMWQATTQQARRSGHQVRILTTHHATSPGAPETDPDAHRTLRWYWDPDQYDFPDLGPFERLGIERHNVRELGRQLRDFQPHVVSWWSMGAMSLSLIERVRRAGIPAVFFVHDDWLVYGPQFDQWIRMWRGKRRVLSPLAERLFGLPTVVDLASRHAFAFNSRFTLERARRAGVDVTNAEVLFPGIDERFLTPAPSQQWAWRLAYVGRIDRQKGVDTAIEALLHLPPEATLSVWGTGDANYVRDMTARAAAIGAGERVSFHGFVEGTALYAAYAEADVVVFPVRWEEPFGLVPLEAMGVGRPVVTTARGGTREFVQHEHNALIFEPGDAQALASCVSRVGRDGALRGRLIEQGRQTAAEYTMSGFAKRAVEYLEHVASSTRQ